MKHLRKSLAWLCAVVLMLSCMGVMEVSARPKLQTLADAGKNLIINGDFEDETEIARQLKGDPIDVPQTWSLVNAAVTTGAANSGKYGLELRPKADETAMAIFDFLHFALAPNSKYVIKADVKSDGKVKPDADFDARTGEVGISRGSVGTTAGVWQTGATLLTITTGADYVYGSLKLSIYKGTAGTCCVDNVTIIANGNEWCPTPKGWVTMPVDEKGNLYSKTNPFTDEFEDETLDVNKWLVSATAWGGDNGGLAAANVSLVTDVEPSGKVRKCVRLESHGDLYEGNVKGSGGVVKRVGAGIVTRPYFASGEYEVVAKIENTLGVCRAFWSFSYIGYMPGDPEFYEDDSSGNLRGNVRNTEIDWEFPSAYNDNRKDDAITLNILRSNCWGGKRPGEGGEFSRRSNPNNDPTLCIADGDYHTFTYVWCAVDDTEDPYKAHAYKNDKERDADPLRTGGTKKTTGLSSVTWYIDGVMVNTYDANDSDKWNAGQENDLDYEAGRQQLGKFYATNGTTGNAMKTGFGINTPYRGARFWIADWFPVNSGKGDLFPAGTNRYTGWAGTPKFDTCVTYIDSCTIKPYYQKVTKANQIELGLPGDEYNYREDVPNKDFVTPVEYPNWQKAHGLLERPIPKTAIDGQNVTVTWDAVPNATAYDIKVDGRVYAATSPYQITGLNVGQHNIQLRAKNGSETGAWSYEAMACIGVPKITAQAEGHRIVVTWPDVPGAVDYYMEVDNCGLMNQSSGAFYSMTSGDRTTPYLQGFSAGTHIVRVRSVGPLGFSNWSALAEVKVEEGGLPIPGLIPKQDGTNPYKWQLIVDEGQGAGSIGTLAKLYEIKDKDGNITKVPSRLASGQYPILDVTLGDGVYSYMIRAIDGNNQASDWSAPIEISNGLANVYAAPGMHVSSGANNVDIWWDYSNQALGNTVTFDLEEDGQIVMSKSSETTFSHTGLATDSVHKYRIRANIVEKNYTTEWSPITTVVCTAGGGGGGGGGGGSTANSSGTILNGTFDDGTNYWSLDQTAELKDGAVVITAGDVTASLTQTVGGCKPNTTYTFSGNFTGNKDIAWVYIRGAKADEIAVKVQDLDPAKGYTFTTGPDVSEITFIVSVYKQQTGAVTCDNLSLSEGSTVTSYTTQATQPTTQPTTPSYTTPSYTTPSGDPSYTTPSYTTPSGDPSDPTQSSSYPTMPTMPTMPSQSGSNPTLPTRPTTPGGILYGDANDDGAVNMKDVLAMRKCLAEIVPLDEINFQNSDVNVDGSVNMKDVLSVRKFIANLIDKLGP